MGLAHVVRVVQLRQSVRTSYQSRSDAVHSSVHRAVGWQSYGITNTSDYIAYVRLRHCLESIKSASYGIHIQEMCALSILGIRHCIISFNSQIVCNRVSFDG